MGDKRKIWERRKNWDKRLRGSGVVQEYIIKTLRIFNKANFKIAKKYFIKTSGLFDLLILEILVYYTLS